jgi:3-isopropylmalate dehydrogenase
VLTLSSCESSSAVLVSYQLLRADYPDMTSSVRTSLTSDFGDRQETDANGVAWDQTIYSIPEVERITRVAAQIALSVEPPLPIISVDKANVLATSRLWRKTVTELMAKEYPQLKLEHQLVDSAAMIMVANPRKLNGVILTENMFGDM